MLPRAEHSEGAGSLPMGLSPPVMQWFSFLEKLFFFNYMQRCVSVCGFMHKRAVSFMVSRGSPVLWGWSYT